VIASAPDASLVQTRGPFRTNARKLDTGNYQYLILAFNT
jgi:hypothetical protein